MRENKYFADNGVQNNRYNPNYAPPPQNNRYNPNYALPQNNRYNPNYALPQNNRRSAYYDSQNRINPYNGVNNTNVKNSGGSKAMLAVIITVCALLLAAASVFVGYKIFYSGEDNGTAARTASAASEVPTACKTSGLIHIQSIAEVRI